MSLFKNKSSRIHDTPENIIFSPDQNKTKKNWRNLGIKNSIESTYYSTKSAIGRSAQYVKNKSKALTTLAADPSNVDKVHLKNQFFVQYMDVKTLNRAYGDDIVKLSDIRNKLEDTKTEYNIKGGGVGDYFKTYFIKLLKKIKTDKTKPTYREQNEARDELCEILMRTRDLEILQGRYDRSFYIYNRSKFNERVSVDEKGVAVNESKNVLIYEEEEPENSTLIYSYMTGQKSKVEETKHNKEMTMAKQQDALKAADEINKQIELSFPLSERKITDLVKPKISFGRLNDVYLIDRDTYNIIEDKLIDNLLEKMKEINVTETDIAIQKLQQFYFNYVCFYNSYSVLYNMIHFWRYQINTLLWTVTSVPFKMIRYLLKSLNEVIKKDPKLLNNYRNTMKGLLTAGLLLSKLNPYSTNKIAIDKKALEKQMKDSEKKINSVETTDAIEADFEEQMKDPEKKINNVETTDAIEAENEEKIGGGLLEERGSYIMTLLQKYYDIDNSPDDFYDKNIKTNTTYMGKIKPIYMLNEAKYALLVAIYYMNDLKTKYTAEQSFDYVQDLLPVEEKLLSKIADTLSMNDKTKGIESHKFKLVEGEFKRMKTDYYDKLEEIFGKIPDILTKLSEENKNEKKTVDLFYEKGTITQTINSIKQIVAKSVAEAASDTKSSAVAAVAEATAVAEAAVAAVVAASAATIPDEAAEAAMVAEVAAATIPDEASTTPATTGEIIAAPEIISKNALKNIYIKNLTNIKINDLITILMGYEDYINKNIFDRFFDKTTEKKGFGKGGKTRKRNKGGDTRAYVSRIKEKSKAFTKKAYQGVKSTVAKGVSQFSKLWFLNNKYFNLLEILFYNTSTKMIDDQLSDLDVAFKNQKMTECGYDMKNSFLLFCSTTVKYVLRMPCIICVAPASLVIGHLSSGLAASPHCFMTSHLLEVVMFNFVDKDFITVLSDIKNKPSGQVAEEEIDKIEEKTDSIIVKQNENLELEKWKKIDDFIEEVEAFLVSTNGSRKVGTHVAIPVENPQENVDNV